MLMHCITSLFFAYSFGNAAYKSEAEFKIYKGRHYGEYKIIVCSLLVLYNKKNSFFLDWTWYTPTNLVNY